MGVGGGHRVSAVVAAYHTVGRVDEVEACAHRLVVGDTLGIVALHYAHYGRRQLDMVFLYHLEVAYDIDFAVGAIRAMRLSTSSERKCRPP